MKPKRKNSTQNRRVATKLVRAKEQASPKHRLGRPRNPLPRDAFEADFLSKYGPEIGPFLHRDRNELNTVHYACEFGGYPPKTPTEIGEFRNKLKNEGRSAKQIAAFVRVFCDSTKRDEWSRLLLQRWSQHDTEFFELVAVVLNNSRSNRLSTEELANGYIQMTVADGRKPTERGFIGFLRAGSSAFAQAAKHPAGLPDEPSFEPKQRGLLVEKSRKFKGKQDPDVVLNEEARRAFRKMYAYIKK